MLGGGEDGLSKDIKRKVCFDYVLMFNCVRYQLFVGNTATQLIPACACLLLSYAGLMTSEWEKFFNKLRGMIFKCFVTCWEYALTCAAVGWVTLQSHSMEGNGLWNCVSHIYGIPVKQEILLVALKPLKVKAEKRGKSCVEIRLRVKIEWKIDFLYIYSIFGSASGLTTIRFCDFGEDKSQVISCSKRMSAQIFLFLY